MEDVREEKWYTVVGFYQDGEDTFVGNFFAKDAKGAIVLARRGALDNNSLAIVAVFLGDFKPEELLYRVDRS